MGDPKSPQPATVCTRLNSLDARTHLPSLHRPLEPGDRCEVAVDPAVHQSGDRSSEGEGVVAVEVAAGTETVEGKEASQNNKGNTRLRWSPR